jgi:hypothetical protein
MENKYAKMFRKHLEDALNAAGVKWRYLVANSAPNTDLPSPVRDYSWRIVMADGGMFGAVRMVNKQRMLSILLAVLKRIGPNLTRQQRFRFWLRVWWAQLRGEFWYG